MKQEDYKKILQTMSNANLRVWMISGFRFWDLNNDGVICSKDIFAMYNKFDEIEEKYRKDYNIYFEKQKGYKIIVRLR